MAKVTIYLDKDEQEEKKKVLAFIKTLKKNEKYYLSGLLDGLKTQQLQGIRG